MPHGHGSGAKKSPSSKASDQRRAAPTRKCVVRAADMDQRMQAEAIRLAEEAMNHTEVEMDVARYIKKAFDAKYTPPWHCIVGRKFGSYVTHESGYFVYFYLDHLAILLFKGQVS